MKQVRITIIAQQGGTIQSGWFSDTAKGEEYAKAMLDKGHLVVREYKNN